MNTNRKQFLDDQFDAFTMLSAGNYVSLYDIQGHLTRYTPAAVELFGLPGEYIQDGAYNWNDWVHPEDLAYYQNVMSGLITGERLTYDLSYRARLRDGSYGMFRFVGAVIRDDDGKPSMVGGIIINEGLVENTDPITVLRNQYGFFADLTAMLKTGQDCVILLIGINRLSHINGEHGYSYGNRILQQVGLQIQEITGQSGIVYRMDGSKFAVVAKNLSEEDAADLYDRIRRKLRNDISIDGVRQTLLISGGLFLVHDRTMNDRTIYTCLKYAYRESKEKKHGALVVFNPSAKSDTDDTLSLLERIRSCMIEECQDFYLEYQPVYRTGDRNMIGVEALIRFRDEEQGEILPERFMPVLEQDFAFEELGIWIMRRAMTDGRKLLETNPELVLGINIAPSQLEDEYFAGIVSEVAQQTRFPLRNLCLELTRGCRFLEMELIRERVAELQEQGVRVLIDDFGSGFGSLEILRELRVDYVKFDMKFVREIEQNETDRMDLRNLCELASVHGPVICVKGVETEKMTELLEDFPITSMQGFYFSRPMAAEKLVLL